MSKGKKITKEIKAKNKNTTCGGGMVAHKRCVHPNPGTWRKMVLTVKRMSRCRGHSGLAKQASNPVTSVLKANTGRRQKRRRRLGTPEEIWAKWPQAKGSWDYPPRLCWRLHVRLWWPELWEWIFVVWSCLLQPKINKYTRRTLTEKRIIWKSLIWHI